MENKLQTYLREKAIRSICDSEKEDYYFSIVDVISAPTDNDYSKSRNYWKVLKHRLNQEGMKRLQIVTS